METKEQYMATPVIDFAETVKKVEEMKANAEANIALANKLKENIAALQKGVEQDIATYKNKTCHHLTANQKRSRAIEMAKDFVEEKIEETALTGELFGIETTIDAEKRKVKVEMHFAIGKQKGKAKCKDGEVFNEHIGEAIALAKALDIVEQLPPDILKAVQPDSMMKGHIILSTNGERYEIIDRNWKGECYVDDFSYYLDGSLRSGLKITDDTNAQYETIKGGE